MALSFRQRRWWLVAAVVLLAAVGIVGYQFWKRSQLPQPGSPVYEEYVEAFQVGVAALDVGMLPDAEENLNRAVGLVPREPAGWADRGLLYLRSARLPEAERDLRQAERLAPDNLEIQKLLGLLEQHQGRLAEAIARLRRVVEKDPEDVEIQFLLAKLVDQEHDAGSDAEYQQRMEQILAVRPGNLHVMLERLKTAVRRGDRAAVNDSLARLRQLAPEWTLPQTKAQLAELEKTLAGPLGQAALNSEHLITFGNVLRGEPTYPRSAEEVDPPPVAVGNPLRTFLRLAPVRHTPAAADTDLTFTPEPMAGAPPGRWDSAVPVWLTVDDPAAVFVANSQEVRRLGTATAIPSLRVGGDGLVPLDWNNDFRTDLLLAGPGGLRFYQQGNDGAFVDVTTKTKLPTDVLGGDYAAALAADVDLDGDLDIVLARRDGPPLLLRNNFDGTFTPRPIAPEVTAARGFAWADFDHDGAPDLAVLDARGRVHVYANERSGQFRVWPSPVPDGPYLALAVGDADDDGVLDLVALRADGAVVRLSDRDKRARWEAVELGRWTGVQDRTEPGTFRLLVADLDNNGVSDLVVSGPTGGAGWLGAGGGKFDPLPASLPGRLTAAANLDGTGRVDLLGLDADGRPIRYRSTGSKKYHWQTIRFRSLSPALLEGDNRINSFGIGGEIEVRTGTYVAKRPITAPVVHFGLGERQRADVARIQWPNGTVQIEFHPPIDQTYSAEQRLKGSCPFLFTWNGERFVFVADFMWSTPLGMYINAQDKGGLLQTREWVKIRGDQLVPRDGHYDVRVNANLWETHYFDHLALHVVDHPADTELFVDERFALEPAVPTFHLTGPPRPVARATDHLGADATAAVRAVDGVYLDRCGRGVYQGVTTDHWVEADLGDDAPREGPVWLVARGWIHPTDSSINYALEQGRHERPRGLVLEVPDGKGGWKVARDRIGFPAGKNKTVLIRLDGLDGPGVARKFRLRTNMEIFWDALHYARGRDDAGVSKKELLPVVADLRERGILAMSQADRSSPELPDYDRVVARGQVWRDLIGYHTRFGDVRELLEKVDDRYAILTAGDDIALRFAAPPGPLPGWKRDFVWVNDGWVKDGDLNTRFGKTVLPLPAHGMTSYDTPPGRLEDDPVYRRHPKDWAVFHTRYVTPGRFEKGLRTFPVPVGRQP
ncbi:MAG: Tetratricopeptide repeat protein [Gemmataceae bacterium]|nr:Tetratricopeptide repeat protein [Gemmataceae bacterium]